MHELSSFIEKRLAFTKVRDISVYHDNLVEYFQQEVQPKVLKRAAFESFIRFSWNKKREIKSEVLVEERHKFFEMKRHFKLWRWQFSKLKRGYMTYAFTVKKLKDVFIVTTLS